MVDFLQIGFRRPKKGIVEIYPKFVVKSTSSDLMIRGGDFYAVWVEEQKRWSTDEQDAIDIIDAELSRRFKEYKKGEDETVHVQYVWDAETGMIDRWHKFCQKQMRDNYKSLDDKIIFANTDVKKRDYASKRLEYALEKMETPAYDRLMSVLYSPEERHKIEWAIGSIVNGDSKKIQKFVTLYGPPGSGKGTVLEIIDRLFSGYTTTFSAKNLGMASAQFALEPFKNNPLVGIQTDGDLSKIEDNSRLNSLISHEKMTVNEKHKTQYTAKFKTFIFLGTNKPVKITDAKSGLLRRLIDVNPSGNKVPKKEYDNLMDQINFELGGIAWHCKEVYESDPRYYDGYIPEKMISSTNDFYNFIIDNYYELSDQDAITLKQAWEMYKTWCDDAKMQYPLNKRAFKDELMNYFESFDERGVIDGERMRSVFTGFKKGLFKKGGKNVSERMGNDAPASWLKFDSTKSLLDREFSSCKAQVAGLNDKPTTKWERVNTTLADIDTSNVHYVQLPAEVITIDFDIPDEDGGKSLEKNMKAAEKWPPTYAELSKSGSGIHLHYIYEGDISELSSIYDDHIEVKLMVGNASLRRKLTKCNDLPIAKINSGLKRKEKKGMYNAEAVKSERKLRDLIQRNLNKEFHPGTKPSIDFIYKILDDAYNSGMKYDVTDLRQNITIFAANSTHQSDYCLKMVGKMKFHSEEFSETSSKINKLVFYDIEVYPNLLLVNWKIAEDVDWDKVKGMSDQEKRLYFLDLIVNHKKEVVRMINPSPSDIEKLLEFKLVGFNCRRYDNHILYGRLMGYSNNGCYEQSQRIISGSRNAFFGEAYNLSYTDVYDFCSKKQGLKKWEIELGFHHQEMGLPWDQPVPEEMWEKVAEYCDNDVLATELTFLCRHDDFVARQILADIAGMTVNDTSNSLTTRIIFGTERRPQSQFNYRDMGDESAYNEKVTNELIKEYGLEGQVDLEFTKFDSKGRPIFPGYVFNNGKSIYRGIEVGEGGRVYANPGIWLLVALLDIASQHPHSIIAEWLFGEFTKNFQSLVDTRIFVKHGDFDPCKKMFEGRLSKYLDDPAMADTLSSALKIPINSVYGLTAASFDNPFKDPRNVDNIVAKRGALFMVNLQHEIERRNKPVSHIKTDSIKIPGADLEIIDFVTRYGKLYGYNFEHECTYDRMCLVNDAVYIAKYATVEKCYELYGNKYVESEKDICKKNKKKAGKWEATGTQFQVPYVYKTLFSHEDISFDDMCETKAVSKGELYLDMNEDMVDVSEYEKELKKLEDKYKKGELSDTSFEPESVRLTDEIAKGHNYIFVGRVGQFCPIVPGGGGGVLYRYQDGKYYAAAGTKGYRWLESEVVKELGKEELIDKSYYISLVDDARDTINQYGDCDMFANNEHYIQPDFMNIPEDSPEELPWDPVPEDEAGKEHP